VTRVSDQPHAMADAILDDEDPLEVPGPGFNQVQEVIIRHASDNTYQMQLIPKSLAMIIAARSPMRSAVEYVFCVCC
jgi:hypothetical protein